MTTAEKIKAMRKAKGMTQQEVAEKVGTSAPNIGQYERGVRKPKLEMLRRLAKAMGCSISDLANFSELTHEDYAEDFQEQESYYTNEEAAVMAQELFHNKEMRLLFDAARGSKASDLRMVADWLNRLKETNPDG